MPTQTQQLLNNFAISAPAVSPVYTVGNKVTDIECTTVITCPTDTAAALQINMERSQDGGATWTPVNIIYADGGVQAKGPNAGQPEQITATTQVNYPAKGDQYRANAVTCVGTFVLSASLTITS